MVAKFVIQAIVAAINLLEGPVQHTFELSYVSDLPVYISCPESGVHGSKQPAGGMMTKPCNTSNSGGPVVPSNLLQGQVQHRFDRYHASDLLAYILCPESVF
jgi:hypothetical protein